MNIAPNILVLPRKHVKNGKMAIIYYSYFTKEIAAYLKNKNNMRKMDRVLNLRKYASPFPYLFILKIYPIPIKYSYWSGV